MYQLSIIKLCGCSEDAVWFLKALMTEELRQTHLDYAERIWVAARAGAAFLFSNCFPLEKASAFFLLACPRPDSALIRFPLIVKQTVGSTSVVSGRKTAH